MLARSYSIRQKIFKNISIRSFTIQVSDEIKQAILENVPVVALESTIITHGLPYPENIQMAKQVESLIRKNGAIPATTGFVKGTPIVGVNEQDLEVLGKPNIQNVKISRRDIPNVMSRKLTGGTTIASTMILANIAKIDVFSTGGLGGISRPWTLFDVSADLDELSKTPIAVVCSGPKSILDIHRTMEYLETKGVPVSTYIDDLMLEKLNPQTKQALEISRNSGDPKELNAVNSFWEKQGINVPGFYVRDSGVKSPYVWENPQIAASMIFNGKYRMQLDNGYVFCAPAPANVAMDKLLMDRIIDDTLKLAEQNNIQGKDLTPFMLQKIYEDTKGESAKCNIAFVKNNAILGTEIAKQLSIMKGGKNEYSQPTEIIEKKPKISMPISSKKFNTMVVGSVALDRTCKIGGEMKIKDSNPGKITESVGGVGFNVTLAGTSYDSSNPIILVTAINKEDSAGELILKALDKFSLPINGIINLPNESTAQYISMHKSDGELTIACADMDIIEKIPKKSVIELIEKYQPKTLLIDLNITPELIDEILVKAKELDIKVLIEPTSGTKCSKLSQCHLNVYPETPIELITPTLEELNAIYQSFVKAEHLMDIDNWFSVLDTIGVGRELREQLDRASFKNPLLKDYLKRGVFQQAFQLLPYFPTLVIKDGANGILVIQITNDAEAASQEVSKQTQKFIKPSSSDFVVVSGSGRHNYGVVVQHFPSHKLLEETVSVTGAGDSLAGSILAQISKDKLHLLHEVSPKRDILFDDAQRCAIASLGVSSAVNREKLMQIKV